MAFFSSPLLSAPGMQMPRSRRMAFVLALSMMAAFGPLCTDTYLPSLPIMAEDLSLSTAMTQATITASLLGMAVGQLFIGPVSDGTGRRRPLFLALILFTMASVLCATAQSGYGFIAFRFAQGLGGAGGIVLSRAISCDLFQGAELTSFMALLMTINGVAPILGPLLGGTLAEMGGWPVIFLFLAGFGLFLLFMTLRVLPETLPPERRRAGGLLPSLRNTGRLFREKIFLCYAGVQGFTMAGFFGYVAASSFVFQDKYGLSATTYSVIFGITALSVMLTAVISSRVVRRVGEDRLLLTCDSLRCVFCLTVLGVCLLDFSSPVPLILSLMGMVALQGATMAASFTLAIASQSVGAGAASGLLGVSVFLFGALSSPLVGLAGPDSAMPLGVVSAMSGLCALSLTLLGRRLRRHSS